MSPAARAVRQGKAGTGPCDGSPRLPRAGCLVLASTVDAVLVADLHHFLDMPHDAPTPARRLAEQLSRIVRAATAGEPGVAWQSALACGRRPAHCACTGHIAVARFDVPASIQWQCTACGDDGVITGWQQSRFDLRSHPGNPAPAHTDQVVISAETAAALCTLVLLDPDSERMVFSAHFTDNDIMLAGDEDDFDELIGYVAAEANHEPNRRRRKQLDAAFKELRAASRALTAR